MSPQEENTGTPTTTDVILRYEALRDRGEEVTPEALCERLGCPHLLEEVRQQIHALESFHHFLRLTTLDYKAPSGPAEQVQSGPQVPGKIEHYEILDRLGQGGFGIVWRALDTELNRPVAIKVPRPDRGFSPDEIGQFYKEARKAAALDHPNIVRVYHARRLGKSFFLVSEFIDGGNLAARKAERPFSPEESARLVAQVADALHHAHLRGFVHRDVKPGNILLNRDLKPYLADFGLAVTEEEQLEESAGTLGTVAYMSPEQAGAENRRVDARTDIYSLGVVLYELLTGRLPFVAKTTQEYLDQIRHREPRPPRTINDAIPAELERICLKCLSKSVADRYTTAADLAADLRRWLEADPAPTPAVQPGAVIPKVGASPPRQRRWLVPAAVGVLALVGLVLLLALWLGDNSPAPRPEGPKGNPPPKAGRAGPAVAAPKPGVWVNLLDEGPLPLLPAKRGSVWQYDAKKKEFWWDAHEDCMFRLGSTRSDDYEVEITFTQTHLAGHRGLFLGYGPGPEQDRGAPRGLILVVVPDPLKRGNHLLFQGELVVDADKKRVQQLQPRGPHVSPTQLSEKVFTLSARVKDGKLNEVRVDRVPVDGLELGAVPPRLVPVTGDFGVYADYDSARITRARWKTYKEVK